MALSAVLLSLAILLTQLQVGSSAHSNPLQRLSKRGQQHSLQKRADGVFPGRATFYDPGLGACGNTNGPGDFIVALNAEQYNANKWCGKKIKITSGGKSTYATIQDECPGCPFGGLDMTPSLFEFFASKDAGVFYMKWSLEDGSSDQPPPEPKPVPPPPSPPPPKPEEQPPPKKEDPPPPKPEEQPPPKKEDPPPPKPEEQPPPKKEYSPPPPNNEPPPKDDPPPEHKNDKPPPYSPTPNPFTTFQPGINGLTGSSLASSLSFQPKPITNTPSSTVNTGGTTPNLTPNAIQSTFQTTSYVSGGNLDAINQLVISFGSLTAASAGSALNRQS